MRAADASIECRIRPARIGEAAALSELCFRSKQVWGYDDDFMAFCREPLRAPAGEPATLDLDKLFIEPGWIRGGVGRLLLAHAIGEARRRGATRLTILADPNAAAFYEQNGGCFIRMASSDAIPGRFVPLYEIVW
ncbi:MAG: GNAT family N-acetyltransferase [Alphaproteobacteria bacterium]|nr:MAG: GNAT family N-acetyltransferase [Alphaproteobacteria bacterium]